MLNSKDIQYVREERLHNEMKFLQEKRSYLLSRLRDSRGRGREDTVSKLHEIETQVCYVFREIECRRRRKDAHASYLKKKNYGRQRSHRDGNRNHRDGHKNNRNNYDNRANRSKNMV